MPDADGNPTYADVLLAQGYGPIYGGPTGVPRISIGGQSDATPQPSAAAPLPSDLLVGPRGVGGNFGTMTPQEEAVAVTPGSVLDAAASGIARQAAIPGQVYAGSGNVTPDASGMISDEDMARALMSEGYLYNKGVPEAALGMIAGGGPGAEAAAADVAQPSHFLGITREKLLNAEDTAHEALDRLHVPGEDWLYENVLDRPLPGHVLGSGTRKLAPVVAAPAIRKQATPLFDYSRLRDVPDVPQFDLPRYVPPRGVPQDFLGIDKATINRANQTVGRGLQQGGLEWYNTLPLRDVYSEILGSSEGPQRYRGYLNAVGASSPDSIVPTNIRAASYYDYLLRNDLPLPQRIKKPETGNWYVPPGQIEPGYGARAQALHVQNMEALRDTGQLPVLDNPKPPSFIENLSGNYRPVTVDRHNLRLFGIDRSAPDTGYGYMEGLQQPLAAKLGVTPAQYQAGGWIGGAQETGVRSGFDPFLQHFENAIRSTAEQAGITPQAALKEFVRGKLKLK